MKKVLLSAILVASVMSCVKREDVTDTITNNVSTEEGVKRTVTIDIFNGQPTTSETIATYSEGNKIASVKTPESNITYTYNGNLIVKVVKQRTNDTITEDYMYDTNGRLIREVRTSSNNPLDSKPTQTDYTYNADGKIEKVITKSGSSSVNNGITYTTISSTSYQYIYNSATSISYTEISSDYSYTSNDPTPVIGIANMITGTAKLDTRGNVIYREDDNGNKRTMTFDDKVRPQLSIKGFLAIAPNDGHLPGFVDVNNETSSVVVSLKQDLVNGSWVTTPQTTNYTTELTYDAKGRVIKEVEKREGVETSNTQFFY